MFTGNGGENPGRCHILGKKIDITSDMSCGLYVHGKPNPEGEVEARVTPKEAGLVKREVRCVNCAHYTGGGECDLFIQLNKSPKMDLDVRVHPQGCCNANTKKGTK